MKDNSYTLIPNRLLLEAASKLTAPTYKIYIILWKYTSTKDGAKKGIAWPSQTTLAEHAGCKRWTVNRCIKEIVDAGFATKEHRRGNSCEYSLVTDDTDFTQVDASCVESHTPTSVNSHTSRSVESHTGGVGDVTQGVSEKSHTISPSISTKKSTIDEKSEKPPTYSSKIPQVSNPIFWNPDTGKVEWPQFQRTGDEQLDLMAKLWYDYQIMWNWEVRDDDETRFREVPEWDDGHERHIWAFTQAFVTKDHNHAMRMAYRYMFLAFFSPDIWLWRKKSMKPTWEQLARFGDELVISKYQELKEDGWEYEKSDAEAKAAYALRQQRQQQQMGAN